MSRARGHAFLDRLANTPHELPISPDLINKLFAQTGENAFASVEDIARTIGRDQGLTARLLTLANSAYYGLQAQVTSVSRAIMVLGLKEVRRLVLALGVRAFLGSAELPPEFDLSAYWDHQVRVSEAARHLARAAGTADPDAVATAALLHDLGKAIIAMHAPDDWRAMETLRREHRLSSAGAEDAYWGLDHGVVGGLVLGLWNLPGPLVEPVNWHHYPELAPASRTDAALVGLADALSCLEPGTGPDSAPETLYGLTGLTVATGIEALAVADAAPDLIRLLAPSA